MWHLVVLRPDSITDNVRLLRSKTSNRGRSPVHECALSPPSPGPKSRSKRGGGICTLDLLFLGYFRGREEAGTSFLGCRRDPVDFGRLVSQGRVGKRAPVFVVYDVIPGVVAGFLALPVSDGAAVGIRFWNLEKFLLYPFLRSKPEASHPTGDISILSNRSQGLAGARRGSGGPEKPRFIHG